LWKSHRKDMLSETLNRKHILIQRPVDNKLSKLLEH
jgi:hypothetical protein